jgi:hypothetical protein
VSVEGIHHPHAKRETTLSLSLSLLSIVLSCNILGYLVLQTTALLLLSTTLAHESTRLLTSHTSAHPSSIPPASFIPSQITQNPAQSSISLAFRCEPALLCSALLVLSSLRPRQLALLHFFHNTDTAHSLFYTLGHRPSAIITTTTTTTKHSLTHSLVQTHALGVTFLLRPSLGSFTERTVG